MNEFVLFFDSHVLRSAGLSRRGLGQWLVRVNSQITQSHRCPCFLGQEPPQQSMLGDPRPGEA